MPYPQINQLAPGFTGTALMENGTFKEISLSDYKGKYVVLIFYPMDFTFVCPTEITAFSDRLEEFEIMGATVVACSTDSKYTHLAWMNTPREDGGLGNSRIPILADKSMEISRSYGVLDEKMGIAFRGLFIIDRGCIVRQITVNDLSIGRSVNETLRLVQAYIYTDTHGEACPIDWKPGKRTVKEDPDLCKEYFKNEKNKDRHDSRRSFGQRGESNNVVSGGESKQFSKHAE